MLSSRCRLTCLPRKIKKNIPFISENQDDLIIVVSNNTLQGLQRKDIREYIYNNFINNNEGLAEKWSESTILQNGPEKSTQKSAAETKEIHKGDSFTNYLVNKRTIFDISANCKNLIKPSAEKGGSLMKMNNNKFGEINCQISENKSQIGQSISQINE